MTSPRLTHAAARWLRRPGMLDRLLWLRARLGRRELCVITYHRVGSAAHAGGLDPGVFDVTAAELEAHLDVLRTHATVVSLSDVRRFFRGRRPPPNPVLITFDDGYADMEAAVPILRRAGVPATFFIATAYPDAGRVFWWDRIWLLLGRSRRPRVDLAYPERLTVHPGASLSAAATAVVGAVKRAERLDFARLWEALEQATGATFDPAEERALASRVLCGWSAVRRIRAAGMDVQSHSHDHVVLNTLSPEAAERDLRRSAGVLREVLGEAPIAVAYPVGYSLTGAHRRAPEAAGFELGFTYGTGLTTPSRTDPFNVPRVSVDAAIGLSGYKARLLLGDGHPPLRPWTPGRSHAPPASGTRLAAEAQGA